MSRAERRALVSVDRRLQKLGAKLQNGDAGPWVELSREKLDAAIGGNLAFMGAKHGWAGAARGPHLSRVERGWYNNHYSVMLGPVDTKWGLVDHIWVMRTDKKPVRDWTVMQDIKNTFSERGTERTAVEVYPPEREVYDLANWYHLWVLPLGFELPFSLTGV